jgi:hypothetical protein
VATRQRYEKTGNPAVIDGSTLHLLRGMSLESFGDFPNHKQGYPPSIHNILSLRSAAVKSRPGPVGRNDDPDAKDRPATSSPDSERRQREAPAVHSHGFGCLVRPAPRRGRGGTARSRCARRSEPHRCPYGPIVRGGGNRSTAGAYVTAWRGRIAGIFRRADIQHGPVRGESQDRDTVSVFSLSVKQGGRRLRLGGLKGRPLEEGRVRHDTSQPSASPKVWLLPEHFLRR